MPKVGEKAPDFELPNQDNKLIKLSDYRGKKVILFAYPAAATPGCTEQACGFREQFPNVQSKNAIILGISADTPADQLAWKKAENLPYDLLSDEDHHVLEQWGAWGEKSMFGNTYFGIIRSHWVIDENGVVIEEKVKIKPKDSVENAVKALGG